MTTTHPVRAYDEVVDFFASGPSREEIGSFRLSEEALERAGVHEGHTLLGLYEGVPLTSYGRHYAPYPEIITIYQRAIEDYCRHNPTRIREQVRSTVLHEVAHHFGMGHEDMPIWVK